MFSSTSVCLHVCDTRGEAGFSFPLSPKHRLFEELVRRDLRHTSWTPTHMDTHLPGRESVCYENMPYDLTLAISLPLCLQNPMGVI